MQIEDIIEYFIVFLTNDEKIKKLPEYFVEETSLWMKSWLLKANASKASIESDNNKYLKEKLLRKKIPLLLDKTIFEKELLIRILNYNSLLNLINSKKDFQKITSKECNEIIENNKQKNIIKDSSLNVGGNFHTGDINTSNHFHPHHSGPGDIVIGNKNIVNNYGNEKNIDKKNSNYFKIDIEKLETLISQGKIEDAIYELIDYSNSSDDISINDEILHLSGRFHALLRKKNKSIISESDAQFEENKILETLIQLKKQLS